MVPKRLVATISSPARTQERWCLALPELSDVTSQPSAMWSRGFRRGWTLYENGRRHWVLVIAFCGWRGGRRFLPVWWPYSKQGEPRMRIGDVILISISVRELQCLLGDLFGTDRLPRGPLTHKPFAWMRTLRATFVRRHFAEKTRRASYGANTV